MAEEQLFCIDLDQPSMEGFRHFISSWCWQKNGMTLVVDPGPLSTTPVLLRSLSERGIERVDYILLTHIHIDHAGGVGALLNDFPEARVLCHPDGVRHMVHPEKLWLGSRKVLGEAMADAYGEILPVAADRIGFVEEIAPLGLTSHLTPGHAPHHCCYLVDDLLFAGEVAGVRCPETDGIYMRPATPPRFILSEARASLEKMQKLGAARMVFAHYGLVDEVAEHLETGSRQLDLWVQGAAAVLHVAVGEKKAAFIDWLLQRDPVFANIGQLSADLQRREEAFIGNSMRGMLDYVASLPTEEQCALAAA